MIFSPFSKIFLNCLNYDFRMIYVITMIFNFLRLGLDCQIQARVPAGFGNPAGA